MNAHSYFAFILLGYLSGSVLYAYLIPKYLCHVDVTKKSRDGNPGAANAFLYAGIPTGICVILLELAKGFFPVYWAARVLDPKNLMFAAVMAAPVVGHAFPFWQLRRGGKAIAVSFGVLLGLLPQYRPLVLLAFFYLIFSLIVQVKPDFYRSIITYLCFSIATLAHLHDRVLSAGCVLISAVVIFRHLTRYRGEVLQIRLHKKADPPPEPEDPA